MWIRSQISRLHRRQPQHRARRQEHHLYLQRDKPDTSGLLRPRLILRVIWKRNRWRWFLLQRKTPPWESSGNILMTEISNLSKHFFQRSLFLRIATLLTWLKSTLLLKIKCFDTTIYMKTQHLQTNETQYYSWKERCLRSRVGKRKGSIN